MNVDDVTIPKFTVIQYVRNKKRIPHGVIVAIKTNGGFRLGYSLCNKKDSFNKKRALRIALGRAEMCDSNTVGFAQMEGSMGDATRVPHSVRRMMPAFTDRCKRYYKNGT